MFQNFLKTTFRQLINQKLHTVINIPGLAIGIACCVVILMYVRDELNYDGFHAQKENIFRVTRISETTENINRAANTASAPGPTMVHEFPQVEKSVRFMFPYPSSVLMEYDDKQFYETGIYWTDSTVFDIFSFPLTQGNPQTALTEPFTMVISERAVQKYFPNENPIGKVIQIGGWTTSDYKITGVLEDVPENSHLKFDFLASMAGEISKYGFLFGEKSQWNNHFFYTYVLLNDASAAAYINQELPDFAGRHFGEEAQSKGFTPSFELQPMGDIHLRSQLAVEPEAGGDIRYVYLFSAVAFFVLLIACINFINLTTARASKRAKEVGVRKVLGASRQKLVFQFLGESVIMSVLACLLALFFIESFLPVLNNLSGKSLSLSQLALWQFLLGFGGLVVIISLLSGSYPAFFLSGFQPVTVLKAQSSASTKASWLRKGLVVLQFTISGVLITGTWVIYQQMRYISDKKLGFDKEQIVVVPIRTNETVIVEQGEGIKQQLLDHSQIAKVSLAAGLPGKKMMIDNWPINLEGSQTKVAMSVIGADHDYLPLLNMPLVEGRNFSPDLATDAQESYIINETAVKALGLEEPLGKRIFLDESEGKWGTIIGVVKDFHLRSFRVPIGPVAIHIWPDRYACMAVKINTTNASGALDHVEKVWQNYIPNTPFEYTFLDEHFAKLYEDEKNTGLIFSSFALLAIIISCLGLFGLASLLTNQRSREIGIRKVLGASIQDISLMFLAQFSKWVGVAILLTIPIAWYLMSQWLQNFAYHISLHVGLFLLSGGLMLLIAWLTVSYQAISTARANPVEALRDE